MNEPITTPRRKPSSRSRTNRIKAKIAQQEGAQPQLDDDGFIQLGTRDPESGAIVLSKTKTRPTAEAFVMEEYTTSKKVQTLWNYGGALYCHEDNRYLPVEEDKIRHSLQRWLHNAARYEPHRGAGKLKLVPFESNGHTINSALQAVRDYAYLDISRDVPPPFWLHSECEEYRDPDGTKINPRDLIFGHSTNLHVPSGKVLPANPALFNMTSLDFDFESNPREPERWMRFLRELWPDDSHSIDALQEWFGYCVTADTRQQKALVIVGPPRSGKGTIGRVLQQLVGKANVVAPTLASLATPFGLQPLIAKSLAIVSDANFRARDMSIVTERLKLIIGEDLVTIPRKHREDLTCRLVTRFMLMANELPKVDDVSGAMANRLVVLRLRKSFLHNEDKSLDTKLSEEIPGILRWALDGLRRLRSRGSFTIPATSHDLVRQIEEMGSPMRAFVGDVCEIHKDARIGTAELFARYQSWCFANGHVESKSTQSFGNDLRAVVPELERRRGTGNVPFYLGIRLKPDDDVDG